MHIHMKLPSYFYDITHPARWVDPYVSASNEERLILSPQEIADKNARNRAYAEWLSKFNLKGKQMVWQVIQILEIKHSEYNGREWWDRFRDCVFRAFVQPEHVYDSKYFKSWYVLSPEDCYLVNRYNLERLGPQLPPRDFTKEKYISTDKRLRRALLVPVESCRHWRHETTAGRLPDGL